MLYLLQLLALCGVAAGQLIGPVGVTTELRHKTLECNIRHYGAIPDNRTDVAPALERTFNECVRHHRGSRLIVPRGEYLLNRSVVLSNATNWAFQLDGLITLAFGGDWNVPREAILQGSAGVEPLNNTINGEGDGLFLLNAFVIVNAVDFEFYSSNGKGAFQGQGYLYRNGNVTARPRLIRLVSPINTTVRDLILVDSPKFHIVFDFAINLEVYHLTIRGANLGSYDGIDVIGTNYHIHDNEVTNRDECVSVKSPSHHALVENLVCNQVGSGISIGSLNVSAEISNIYAQNISVIRGNNIAFIKTYPGGSGYVANVTFANFRSKASTFGMNVNQYWQNTYEPDTGSVTLSNLTFRNFSGSVLDGTSHAALNLIANDLTFATNVIVEDFSVWTEAKNQSWNVISNIFGTGDDSYNPQNGISSLNPGEVPTPYTSTYTITASPTGWVEPTSPAWAVPTTGYGTASPIPVYTPAPLWKAGEDYDLHYWGSF